MFAVQCLLKSDMQYSIRQFNAEKKILIPQVNQFIGYSTDSQDKYSLVQSTDQGTLVQLNGKIHYSKV